MLCQVYVIFHLLFCCVVLTYCVAFFSFFLHMLIGILAWSDSFKYKSWGATPGAPLTNFYDGGGGGPTEVHISYPQKLRLQDLSTQITTFVSIPKKIP